MILSNNECLTLNLSNADDSSLFYSTNNTRMVVKTNCCNTKTYDLIKTQNYKLNTICYGNSPTSFQLTLSGFGNMVNNITYTLNDTSNITVTPVSLGVYNITMLSATDRTIYFTFTTIAGNTYTTKIDFRNPNNDCGNLDYDSYPLIPSCGFNSASQYDITLSSSVFTGLNCAEPNTLETGVYTVYLQNVDNNGNVLDQQCSSIFIDCNTLQCYILRLYSESPEKTIIALRHYLALQQASSLLNNTVSSEQCLNYLSCEDLCELYKLVLTESQSVANHINYTPYNTSDCGCN